MPAPAEGRPSSCQTGHVQSASNIQDLPGLDCTFIHAPTRSQPPRPLASGGTSTRVVSCIQEMSFGVAGLVHTPLHTLSQMSPGCVNLPRPP